MSTAPTQDPASDQAGNPPEPHTIAVATTWLSPPTPDDPLPSFLETPTREELIGRARRDFLMARPSELHADQRLAIDTDGARFRRPDDRTGGQPHLRLSLLIAIAIIVAAAVSGAAIAFLVSP